MLAEIDRHMSDAVESLSSARRERDGGGAKDVQ
jgi:hypothetical protein